MKCRICGCTDERACPLGCAWASADLCDLCAKFIEALEKYTSAVNTVSKASLARMLDETVQRRVERRERDRRRRKPCLLLTMPRVKHA